MGESGRRWLGSDQYRQAHGLVAGGGARGGGGFGEHHHSIHIKAGVGVVVAAEVPHRG